MCCARRLTGLLDSTSPAASAALQRFFTAFHSAHSAAAADDERLAAIDAASITGVVFAINNTAYEALIEAPTDTITALLTQLQQALPAVSAAAAAPAASAAASRLTSATAPTKPTTASIGATTARIVHFAEETPRSFYVFAVRAIRIPAADDWPNPAPSRSSTVTSGLPSTLAAPPHSISPLLQFTFSTLHALLVLGVYVRGLGEERSVQLEWLVGSMHRVLLASVVSVERVAGYESREELMRCDEWLELFGRQRGLSSGRSERERVWPIEQYIQF